MEGYGKKTIIYRLAFTWSVDYVRSFLKNEMKKINFWVDELCPRNHYYHTVLRLLVKNRETYSERDKKVIELLLKHGANPLQNTCSSHQDDHCGPQHGLIAFLATKKESDLVLLFLHYVRNIDTYVVYFNNKVTPLHLSVTFGMGTVFDYILSRGANVNKPTKHQNDTALHAAARNENGLEMAEKLLQRGASLDVRDRNGQTPMMWAILYNRIEHIKLFSEYGGILLDLNYNGETALHILFSSSKHIDIDICELLLKEGCDPNGLCYGNTTLHYVAKNGELKNKVETTRFLLKNGADLHERNSEGNSVLHCAARYSSSHTAFIKYLLCCGKNANLMNNRKQNFLDILMGCNKQSATHIIKFLIIQEKVKNIQISPSIQNTILNSDNFLKLYETCRTEAEILGDTMIDPSGQNISLLTLLSMTKRKLADLCEIPTFRNEMRKYSSGNFSLYGEDVKTKFEVSLKFNERKDLCLRHLEMVSKGVLRYYSLKSIIDYMPNRLIEKIGCNLIENAEESVPTLSED